MCSVESVESAGCDLSICCTASHRRTKLNPGDRETHRLLYDLPADARVLRLAAVRGDLPLQQRVIFTVSTIISTVDSYQYCSKPVVE